MVRIVIRWTDIIIPLSDLIFTEFNWTIRPIQHAIARNPISTKKLMEVGGLKSIKIRMLRIEAISKCLPLLKHNRTVMRSKLILKETICELERKK
jgi:hypothetical protein